MNWSLLNLKNHKRNSAMGFTLIEVLVVVVIIAILAAIAGPGWAGFMKRRKVTAVNDALLQAIEQAKSKAQKEKSPYSVGVSYFDGKPQIAVYPANLNVDTTDFQSSQAAIWGSNEIGSGVNLRENEVVIVTNLDSENRIQDNNSYNFSTSNESVVTISDQNNANIRNNPPQYRITFDLTGIITNTPGSSNAANDEEAGAVFIVGVPENGTTTIEPNSQPLTGTIRCVRVGTLIGGLQVGRNQADCSTFLQGDPP